MGFLCNGWDCLPFARPILPHLVMPVEEAIDDPASPALLVFSSTGDHKTSRKGCINTTINLKTLHNVLSTERLLKTV